MSFDQKINYTGKSSVFWESDQQIAASVWLKTPDQPKFVQES